MKISARNRLKDRIVDVKEGASPANVKIKVGGGIIRQRLPTKRSSSSNLQGAKPPARSSRRAIS
jgi:molybdopterin-binding protein